MAGFRGPSRFEQKCDYQAAKERKSQGLQQLARNHTTFYTRQSLQQSAAKQATRGSRPHPTGWAGGLHKRVVHALNKYLPCGTSLNRAYTINKTSSLLHRLQKSLWQRTQAILVENSEILWHSYAVNPRENSYKPHMLWNHSSLASFLSLAVKAHVHSVTHGQLWKPQHTHIHTCALLVESGNQGHPHWCRQKSRMVCRRNVQLMPTLLLKLTKI